MKPAAILISLAIAVRLFFYFSIYSVQPQKFAIRDLDGYAQIAENLVNSGVYAREPAAPFSPDFSRPPVYPALLAGLMLLGNFNGSLIVLFQILLSAGVVGLVWMLSGELRLERKASFIAALLVALDPITILLPHYLLSDTLFLVEWMAGLVLFVGYLNRRKTGLLIASAVLFALGALTRPILEFLPFALALAILLIPAGMNRRVRMRDSLLFFCLFAALLVPWMLRNQQAGGGFILSDISDTNLYYYRAKAVLADVENISQDAAYQKLDEEIKARQLAQGLTTEQTLGVMRARALQILAQHPLQTVKMTARGAALLLFDPGYSLVCADLDPSNLTPECFQGDASMLGENIFAMMASRFLSMSLLQKITLIWATLLMGLLYLGSISGVIRLIREKRWLALGLLAGSMVYFVALSSGAESLYRLRAPVLPLLAILCGVGLSRFAAFIQYNKKR